MLLSGVLFVLFLAGGWLYCLTDAALTPAEEYPGWSKRAWIVTIALTFIVGAIAWLIVRRPARPARRARRLPAAHRPRAAHWPPAAVDHLTLADLDDANALWYPHRPKRRPAHPADRVDAVNSADAALSHHPAGRSRMTGRQRPQGPDDDPEFLRQLARRIHGDLAE